MDRPVRESRPQSDRRRAARVLGTVLTLAVVTSIARGPITEMVIAVTLVALATSIVHRAAEVPLQLRIANLAVAVPAVSLAVAAAVVDDRTIVGLREVATAVLLLTAIAAIVHRIASQDVVTFATVFAAISAYLLLGLAFAAAYGAVDAFTERMFTTGPAAPFDTTYFSFITLTTVGYGDLVPASDLARSLAMVEVLIGQVVLVVVVARLVGLVGQRRTTP